MKKKVIKTGDKSRTSPTSGTRACLCNDGTYSTKCCDGSLKAQGIGKTQA